MKNLDAKKMKEHRDMKDLQDSAPSKWAGERMKDGNADSAAPSKEGGGWWQSRYGTKHLFFMNLD